MSDTHDFTLTLHGSRAPKGVDAGALAAFMTSFQSALRDHDRDMRGERPRKPGNPEAEASAASALRIVGLRPGSAIVELRPVRSNEDEEQLSREDPPRARVVVDDLLDRVAGGAAVARAVADSLGKALRACGDDPSFEIERGAKSQIVRFDRDVIDRLGAPAATPAPVTAISGRLTQLQETPDRAVVKSPDGTDWRVRFDADSADELQTLWRRNVHVTGHGERTSERAGTFVLEGVAPLFDDAQTSLFTDEWVDTDELLERQGITGPQGLELVAADAADSSDPAEDAYLEAILADA